MGQYFTLVNLDKRQFIHAHQIGNGLKIGEQTGWKYSTEAAAKLLLGQPIDDVEATHPLIGSWVGDARVGFVGDYGDSYPAPGIALADEVRDRAEKLYAEADDEPEAGVSWTNISAGVREMMTAVFRIQYTGQGWLSIVEPSGDEAKSNLRPDLVLTMRK